MFNLCLSYHYLLFRPPLNRVTPLPSGIVRLFADSPSGRIEVLYAAPKGDSVDRNASPLFFVHGGMGSAWVWLEYMTYLSERGVPCYAVSMRGHGESWCPSYVRMVWLTTKRDLADDVVAAIRFVQEREGVNEVVLVGHSSGGGLSQLILSEQNVRVKGLILMGAVPGFGSYVPEIWTIMLRQLLTPDVACKYTSIGGSSTPFSSSGCGSISAIPTRPYHTRL